MMRVVILAIITFALTAHAMFALWIGINGITALNAIERLPLIFSPAGFVYWFSFVLYSGLILYVWLAYQNRQTALGITRLQVFLFTVACVLQMAFFQMWNYGHYAASFTLLVLQLLSLFGLYLTYPFYKKTISLRLPIAMWLGWNSFFMLVIFGYIILYYEWNGFGLSNALWAVILLTTGTAIALHLRYHHFDRITPAIFIFSYIGIAAANGFEELLVSAAALFLSGVMAAGIIFMEKKEKK